jgi:hypothetical protein
MFRYTMRAKQGLHLSSTRLVTTWPSPVHLQERALAEYQKQVDEISARNQAKVSDATSS